MGFTTTHSHGDGVCKIPDSACAAYREQQRIIALLGGEDVYHLLACFHLEDSLPSLYEATKDAQERLIALIKGENE